MEHDVRVVAGGRADQAGEGLLEGGVEGLAVRASGDVRSEAGLGVVEQGGPDARRRDVVVGDEVDAGRAGPARAFLEEDLGERVGREGGEVEGGRVGRVLRRVEADAGRQIQPPRAEVEGPGVRGEDRLGHGVELELGQEGAGLPEGGAEGRQVVHAREDGKRVMAGGPAVVRKVLRGGDAVLVGVGVDREEHDVGQLRRQADLPQPGHDVLEAGVVVVVVCKGLGGLADCEVGLVGQGRGLEPEPGEAGRAGVGREELELQRGQAPAV